MIEWRIPAPVRLFAPAKVNLGLEVSGRRDDGYHEVVTVMETVSLFDVIDLSPAGASAVSTDIGIASEDDLVVRSLHALEQVSNRKLCLRVTTHKAIPVSAGLGGGSSDAGTLIHALGHLTGLDTDTVAQVAASIGSDVPFFLRGGAALATGAGTDIERISAKGRRWYVILVPSLEISGKTATLYGSLTTGDFSDGARTRTLAKSLSNTGDYPAELSGNVFTRPLMEYVEFAEAMHTLQSAGARMAMPSGAGPSAFTICSSYSEALEVRKRMVPPPGTRVLLCTSVRADVNGSRLYQVAGE